jgi:hypothetical protein
MCSFLSSADLRPPSLVYSGRNRPQQYLRVQKGKCVMLKDGLFWILVAFCCACWGFCELYLRNKKEAKRKLAINKLKIAMLNSWNQDLNSALETLSKVGIYMDDSPQIASIHLPPYFWEVWNEDTNRMIANVLLTIAKGYDKHWSNQRDDPVLWLRHYEGYKSLKSLIRFVAKDNSDCALCILADIFIKDPRTAANNIWSWPNK